MPANGEMWNTCIYQPLLQTLNIVLARDACRMAVGGGETCAFVIIYPPFEGVRSPRLGIVKDTVQCRDRFAEFDYQRLIGRVHRLPSFPCFAFSHLFLAVRHSSNVGCLLYTSRTAVTQRGDVRFHP